MTPTVGRIVWVYKRVGNGLPDDGKEAAVICFVHSEKVVNVAGFDKTGAAFQIEYLSLEKGIAQHAGWPEKHEEHKEVKKK